MRSGLTRFIERSVPADPLRRARLAFLALGALGIVSGVLQLAIIEVALGPRIAAGLGLVTLLGLWVHQYRVQRARVWFDLVSAGLILLFLTTIELPDFGSGVIYAALYIQAFYGSRWQTVRAVLLTVGAYLVAEVMVGMLQSPPLMRFVAFQAPAMVVTATIIRILHESLLRQKHLVHEMEDTMNLEAVSRLTGGIAHDFNNLITAILGPLDLALAQLDPDDELWTDLDVARETALQANALTRQLLTFSRNRRVQPEAVKLNEHLEGLEPTLNHLVRPVARIELHLDPKAGVVVAEPAGIQQVVTNLVINAAEAIEESGRGGRIVVRTGTVGAHVVPFREVERTNGRRPEGLYAVLEVSDDGPGMDAETKARVFDPFFSTKKRGSGLGLSTVYGIVSEAGGTLRIESTPGEGTSMTLYLPRTGDAAESVARPRDDRRLRLPEHADERPSRTVLAVEDSDSVRKMLGRVLLRAGYRVRTAERGEEALQVLHRAEGGIDLLIADLTLPDMTGVKLATLARSQHADLPVLFTSSRADYRSFEENESVRPVLTKPYDAHELLGEVERLLGRPGPRVANTGGE